MPAPRGKARSVVWELPSGWADIDPPLDALAAAVPVDQGDGNFVANVQVIALPAEGQSLLEIRAAIVREYAATMRDGRLLDVDDTLLDDYPAVRVLSTHVGEAGDELTTELWLTVVQDVQVVLTCTSLTLDYHWHLEAFPEIAESLEIDV